MVKSHFFYLAFLLLIISCKSTKDDIDTSYHWKREDESITLRLKKNGTFVLEKQGYTSRSDSGKYIMNGDTIVINPHKKASLLESVVAMDSSFYGQRYVEVMAEELLMDSGKVIDSGHSATIFPEVVVNRSVSLAIHPDDPTFKKLLLPDSLEVKTLEVKLHQDNTCKPVVYILADVPQSEGLQKSYRINLRSLERKENYLAGYKWLLKGNTIQMFFANDDCDPTEVKLVKE